MSEEDETDTSVPEEQTQDDLAEAPEEETVDETEIAESEESDESDEAQPSRGQTRQQKLANQLREEREARIRLEAEIAADRRARSQPSTPGPDAERQRAEKLALMTEEERREFLRDERMARLENAVVASSRQAVDSADQAKWEASCVSNPTRAKYAAKVEEQLQVFRNNGAYPQREAVYHYLLGRDADTKPRKATVKQKQAAKERVDSSKSTPLSGKGDAGGRKNQDDDSLEAVRERIMAEERRRGLR